MATSFIPNSSPAIGPTSTLSSAPLKEQNNASISVVATLKFAKAIRSLLLSFFNAERPTLNTQCSIRTVGRSMLDVERWVFLFSRRVKGAWWPSRSSKPLSVRKSRGRFDSCPLRQSPFVGEAVSFPSGTTAPYLQFQIQKGGDVACRVNGSGV